MATRREFLIRSGQGLASLALLPGGTQFPGSVPGLLTSKTPAPAAASLNDKIGQMVLVGFRGMKLDSGNPILVDIRERHIGGVILFDYDVPSLSPVRNIESPSQVKDLAAALKEASPSPLLIAVDQEGGKVSRLKEKIGFPATVSQQALGTKDDIKATRQSAEETAKTLAECGFNINFSPVVDLNINPENPVIGGRERSFSADPDIVTRHAVEVIKAHRTRGILTTLKHFPGHGSSTADSHLGFTDVTETWSRKELTPYARLIGEGLCDSVMTAHIFNAALDPDLPATLSAKVITGLLREGLAYNGPVISDDMQMKAISARYGFEEAILLAIGAGVDILTFANNSVFDPDVAASAIGIIRKAVRDGKVGEERIDRSYARIMRLKSRLAEIAHNSPLLASRFAAPRHVLDPQGKTRDDIRS
jgi:beta-N-acetylhexosaminidase